MKGNRFALLAAFAAVVLFSVRPAQAQEEAEPGVYGFTSLNYDSQTNQLTVYSETDTDGGDCGYYFPVVQVELNDPNNNWLGGDTESGPECGSASATFSVTPQTSGTFSADADHLLTAEYEEYCSMSGQYNCFVDYDNFSWWVGFYIDYSGAYGFSDPFSGPQYIPGDSITLGETYDNVSDTIKIGSCLDDRDQIIAEYENSTYHPVWIPTCGSFTNTSPDPGNWSFGQLDTSDYLDWAIIQQQETSGLDAMTTWLNSHPPVLTISLTSAYRNPAKEYRVAQQYGSVYAPDSRHMLGDGVDMATDSSNWDQFHEAGKSAGACVEPYQEQGNQAHVHADWRVQDTSVGLPGPTACPTEPYPW